MSQKPQEPFLKKPQGILPTQRIPLKDIPSERAQPPGPPSERPTAHLTLTALNGPLARQRFPIDGDGLMIGRDSSVCQVVFPADYVKVSRRHCRLVYDRERHGAWLYDTNSSRGTFLSHEKRLTPDRPVLLRPGDKFFVAWDACTFRVED